MTLPLSTHYVPRAEQPGFRRMNQASSTYDTDTASDPTQPCAYLSVNEAYSAARFGLLKGKRACIAYWQSGGAHDFPKVWRDWRPYRSSFKTVADVTVSPNRNAYLFLFTDGTSADTTTCDTLAVLDFREGR
ncbi:hypothetical protein [Catenulispora rubra]|uniref:hypothetical protein n=1 Tax=Catenulispora rubra TaxID=280293 RepID=UPI00189247D2|nr:hypothetical protein [Catenulispora rubra]